MNRDHMPEIVSLDEALSRLDNVHQEPSGQYRADCPAHESKSRKALHVMEGENGKAVFHCFGKCTHAEIMEALGFRGGDHPNGHPNGRPQAESSKKRPKILTTEQVYYRPVFEFRTPSGEVSYVQRHKGAYYRPLGNDLWEASLEGVTRLPYNLPELLDGVRAGKTVYHVEGCKDVKTAREKLGVVATTSGGADSWRPEYKTYYTGADVVVIRDHDEAGMEYAETVAQGLYGVAKSVKIVTLPGLAKGGDLTDFFKQGGTEESFYRVVQEAPLFKPTDFNSGNSAPKGITAAELMEMEFEPTRWIVPDVLPEGLSLLVGKPKKGKSWMALGICETVAVGGVALGTRRVEQGDSLYLALEDNPKRLKKRLKKVLDGRPAPKNMHLYTEWSRLCEGGAEALDEWLTGHPNTRLVAIDTLAKIRKPASGANVYAEDYAALAELLPLAAKHGVAIVVVHHLRKMAAADPMDEISSSTGLTAGVDGFLILRRTPGSKGPTLYVDGRDIEEPTEYALHWNLDTATWTLEGDAEEVHVSKERADILLTLNRNGAPMTPKEVSGAMDAKYNSIKKLMWTMLGDGQLLKNDKGAYYPATPTTSGNPGNSGNPGADSGNTVTGLPLSESPGNPGFADTYKRHGHSVTEVTGVGRKLPLTTEQVNEYQRYRAEGLSRQDATAKARANGSKHRDPESDYDRKVGETMQRLEDDHDIAGGVLPDAATAKRLGDPYPQR